MWKSCITIQSLKHGILYHSEYKCLFLSNQKNHGTKPIRRSQKYT
uniref:Uncharacterized protein n=1 Tax=Rhizophora mucronata TaxID=61149 RepID=A0A2P2PSY5_RHIMU